jgi:pimeloyl-ACP methyl ester carboxylesterase
VLENVERRRVTLPSGIEIALLDWGGAGPLALLHHANGFCGAMWGIVAQGLRPHYRVVAVDARGHGDSAKPRGKAPYHWARFPEDLEAVASGLAREHRDGRIRIGVGHSFGGVATLGAAARRPELFERILLVDPVIHSREAYVPRDPERARRIGKLVRGARRRRHHFASRAEARAWFEGRKIFANWLPEALDLYVAEALAERPDGSVELKCPGAVEAAVFEQGGSLDVHGLAPDVRAPTLLLWAKRGSFPRSAYEALVARMPDARIEDIDSGHLVPMERPELVVEAALAFGDVG